MIRSHRNHPSIVVWSMTNEAFFTFNLEQAKALMREMVQWHRHLDSDPAIRWLVALLTSFAASSTLIGDAEK